MDLLYWSMLGTAHRSARLMVWLSAKYIKRIGAGIPDLLFMPYGPKAKSSSNMNQIGLVLEQTCHRIACQGLSVGLCICLAFFVRSHIMLPFFRYLAILNDTIYILLSLVTKQVMFDNAFGSWQFVETCVPEETYIIPSGQFHRIQCNRDKNISLISLIGKLTIID